MKTYMKPSIEVIDTELEQMLSISTVTTDASPDYDCLNKGENAWTDGSSFWGN
ncbi:MAG: hypothetical protein LUC33_06305 [Prevotellaceae bacterium]|nr:hypothetical protein [Prevotellaceae bacterium]